MSVPLLVGPVGVVCLNTGEQINNRNCISEIRWSSPGKWTAPSRLFQACQVVNMKRAAHYYCAVLNKRDVNDTCPLFRSLYPWSCAGQICSFFGSRQDHLVLQLDKR